MENIFVYPEKIRADKIPHTHKLEPKISYRIESEGSYPASGRYETYFLKAALVELNILSIRENHRRQVSKQRQQLSHPKDCYRCHNGVEAPRDDVKINISMNVRVLSS